MEKLALEVFGRDGNGGQFARLYDDTSITITETSELFDTGDIWSFAFKLNINANLHIFGTSGEVHGSRLHEQVDKRRARLWVEGIPLYLGYLKLDDEVDVDANGDISVGFESGRKTFAQMIEGVKANQVPVKDDILIGMALDRERTLARYGARMKVTESLMDFFGGTDAYSGEIHVQLESDGLNSQMFPKYVRPDGTWENVRTGATFTLERNSTVNTYMPYDSAHPYCSIPICYQKKEWKENNGTLEKNALRAYKKSEPRRINPSPNFFVLYWLDCLMKHLGIIIRENGMSDIEDLKRLFFLNTKCAYKTKGDAYTGDYLPAGQGSLFVPPNETDNPSWSIDVKEYPDVISWLGLNTAEMKSVGTGVEHVTWHPAYATSDNFPAVDIGDVIEAVENGFGVRFMFNSDYTDVRIVLLCDVLKADTAHEVSCDVLEVTKRDSSIRGFRLTYGGAEDNTSYHYKGFDTLRKNGEVEWLQEEELHDYSQWDFGLTYSEIESRVSMLNKTCYVDSTTGNAYIVKIDENFKDASQDAYPSLLECAQFMDAEEGDCSGSEETVKEVRIGFTPMEVNTVLDGVDRTYAVFVNEDMSVPCEPRFGIDALPDYADSIETDALGCSYTKDDVRYKSGLMEVATAVSFVGTDGNGGDTFTIGGQIEGVSPARYWSFTFKLSGWIREGYRLYLDDNYDINDDMECPLEKHDWGLTFGIMRGARDGIDGANVKYYADMAENEGNDTWIIEGGGSGDVHSDTCSPFGGLWTYEPGQWIDDEVWGDEILRRIGWQNQCDLKNRRGPALTVPETMSVYDSYFGDGGNRLMVLPDSAGDNSPRFYIHEGTVTDGSGTAHSVVLCCVYGGALKTYDTMFGSDGYLHYLQNGAGNTAPENVETILQRDLTGYNGMSRMILAVDPPADCNGKGLIGAMLGILRVQYSDVADWFSESLPSPLYEVNEVCKAYLRDETGNHYLAPDGTEDQSGRFSLKLRAEKPNPYFDPSLPENSTTNRRYLEITNPSLRRRGLMDKFHKEESYWWRNAKIANIRCRMGVAELKSIDKTVRQILGDVTGFVMKLQYTVHIQSGLGTVNAEVWYL